MRWCPRRTLPALSGGSEFQTLEVLPDRLAKPFAAGDGGAAGHHQDEVPARGAAHFPHVTHVHQTRAADAQHRLRLKGSLSLLQRAARVKSLATDGEAYVVAVGLHHLHLRHVQHMHAAARLRQHARLRLRAYPCSALQLLEKRFEGAAPVEGAVRLVTAAHAKRFSSSWSAE